MFVVQCISTPRPNWSFSGQCDWGNHGLLRRTTCSSRPWTDRMTWPPTLTTAASTWATLSTTGRLDVHDIYRLHLHTGLTLVRRITCYFHPGHCYVPAPPVMMRATEDAYKWWLTAANQCRRGSRLNDVWSGAPRSGATNISCDENNAEKLRTADLRQLPTVQCPTSRHLHSFILQLFSFVFLYFFTITTFVFLSSRYYVFTAMISPIA